MTKYDFIPTIKHKIAIDAIGFSALRGQGKGVIGTARDHLSKIKLGKIPRSNRGNFNRWLDRQTEAMLDCFPCNGRPWGAARKGLNLFLRDTLYSHYLRKEYRLTRIEHWLEIPLDSAVAKGLRMEAGRGGIPRWPGLKHLTPDISDCYQEFASKLARKKSLARVHLDIYLWIKYR